MHSTLNSKTLDLCFLQTNYECAHRRCKVEHFKKQFLWKQFFFHPNLIMRVELVWGANWKTMENLTVYCLDLFDEENISIDRSPYPLRCAVQVSSWSYLCPEESLTKEFQPHLWTGGSTISTTFSLTDGIIVTYANTEQVQPTLPSSISLQSPHLGTGSVSKTD